MDHESALPSKFRFDEYEIVRVLGAGGFGITYLGFDHHLDKPVAIKEYLPNDLAVRKGDTAVVAKTSGDLTDYQWGLDRFLAEARVLAKFDHFNLPKVYRFFEAHGTAYIVMEYAEGDTLSQLLKQKKHFTENELNDILLPLLDGLEQVHQAGFLHRDIKPGNIIIRDDNSPMLLDFGSARAALGAKSRSVTSIVTPGYAPIEQYSTKGNQGPWTDVYAAAAVAYKMLTGDTPDDATERIRRDPLVPLSEKGLKRVSESLINAIDQGLLVDEEDRPKSISEWLDMFGLESSPEPISKRISARIKSPKPVNNPVQKKVEELSLPQSRVEEVSYENLSSDHFNGRRLVVFTFLIAVFISSAFVLFNNGNLLEPSVIHKSGKTEKELWSEAHQLGTIQSYQRFINRFPNSSLTKLAKVKIVNKERDAMSWETAKNKDSRESYEGYLAEYPNGEFIDLAQIKLQSL